MHRYMCHTRFDLRFNMPQFDEPTFSMLKGMILSRIVELARAIKDQINDAFSIAGSVHHR